MKRAPLACRMVGAKRATGVMEIIPAIDLLQGSCVRLHQGDYDQVTRFSDDPLAQAQEWVKQGATRLHLVDLDGARSGEPINDQAVRLIAKELSIPVQLGGGVRSLERAEELLSCGLDRVILGTAALRDPDLVIQACRDFPGRIAVGIDARQGFVAVEGWAETSRVKALDLALKFENAGAAAIIYTDIDRDGMMRGANIEATVDLAWALTTPVIASGGVSTMDDLRELKNHESAGIEGVICGRALYDGRIDPEAALDLLSAGDV